MKADDLGASYSLLANEPLPRPHPFPSHHVVGQEGGIERGIKGVGRERDRRGRGNRRIEGLRGQGRDRERDRGRGGIERDRRGQGKDRGIEGAGEG